MQLIASLVSLVLLFGFAKRQCFGEQQCFTGSATNITTLAAAASETKSPSLTSNGSIENFLAIHNCSSRRGSDGIESTNTSSATHCTLVKSLELDQAYFSCDLDDLCSGVIGVKQMCVNGTWAQVYCCTAALCNNYTLLSITSPPEPNMCLSGVNEALSVKSCGYNLCSNVTDYDQNGVIIQRSFGCAGSLDVCVNNETSPGFCHETSQSTGRRQRTCISTSNAHLLNTTSIPNTKALTFPMSASSEASQTHSLPTTTSSTSPSSTVLSPTTFSSFTVVSRTVAAAPTVEHYAYLGTIGALVVVGLLIFTLVALGVKKYRDKHRLQSTYTYAQLTVDLAEEERDDSKDEYLLIA